MGAVCAFESYNFFLWELNQYKFNSRWKQTLLLCEITFILIAEKHINRCVNVSHLKTHFKTSHCFCKIQKTLKNRNGKQKWTKVCVSQEGSKVVCRSVNVQCCFLLWLKVSVKLKRKLQAPGHVENWLFIKVRFADKLRI